MDIKLLGIFIILNVVNVVIQTIKSIATVKCSKLMASIVNAIAYGLYTIVLIYMSADLPLMMKAGIVALCNLIGVYVVKWGEEKARKDKLWEVRASVPEDLTADVHRILDDGDISHNYIENVGKYSIFNIYCPTQLESLQVREILESGDIKYFVSESKTL